MILLGKKSNKRLISWLKQHSQYCLLLYVPIYLVAFFLLEKYSPANYFISYIPLDDKIPFCEYFVIFYCLWYPFLAVPGLYFLIKNTDEFRRYMYFIMIGFTASMIFYVIFPNGQNLRPDIFPRNNFFTWLIQQLYNVDTNTNVLPSMHVVGCIAVFCSVLYSKCIKKPWVKWGTCVLSALISVSTIFIKQHSALDLISAILLCIPIALIVYLPKRKQSK